MQVDRGENPLEFRHADRVKFRELVTGLGPDYEEWGRPTLHKLVGSWSCSPDEPKAGRNQSVLRKMCGVAGWVSNKCLCETAARAAPLHERVGP